MQKKLFYETHWLNSICKLHEMLRASVGRYVACVHFRQKARHATCYVYADHRPDEIQAAISKVTSGKFDTMILVQRARNP